MDYLGWINFTDHRILRTKTKNRMLKNIKNNPTLKTFSSYCGLLKHGKTKYIKKQMARFLFSW
jgi:hypothetical protein